jgi:hypothetical protein
VYGNPTTVLFDIGEQQAEPGGYGYISLNMTRTAFTSRSRTISKNTRPRRHVIAGRAAGSRESPCHGFTVVFAFVRQSAFWERPTSSISLNCPVGVRFAHCVLARVFSRSRVGANCLAIRCLLFGFCYRR